MSDPMMKIRMLAAAFIAGSLYIDPLQYTGVVGFDTFGMTLEGAFGGLLGGDLAAGMRPGASTFEIFSGPGKTYAICGGLAGLASGYLGLGPLYSAGLGAASVLLDTTVAMPLLGKL